MTGHRSCHGPQVLGEPAPAPFDPALLRSGRQLRDLGIEPGRSGWHHVRRGMWVDGPVWASLNPEQRHAALVHATDLTCRSPGAHVWVLASAAAVWGLPRVEAWPGHATALATGPRTRGSAGVHIHVGRPTDGERMRGIRVTGVARTVVDLARTGSFATALCAADHALRHRLCTRDDLERAADAVPPRVRGRPAALVVGGLADARSMSPGESLSRAVMFRRGVPRPDLQVEVEDEDGLVGITDFGWPGVFGEFDGRVKYRVPEDADPELVSEVLWREKRREDRLRRRGRLARWGWSDARDEQRLLAILAEQGVRPDPRSAWLDDRRRRAS